MAVSSSAEFIALLERSHLLEDEQLSSARELLDLSDRPRVVAKQLVQEGWLTRWQAQQLLAGRDKLYFGKYKLLERIGEGGMGTVFKAEQPGFNRVVALKVLLPEILKNTDAVARFMREIRSAAALNHPHIVAAYDADCVGQTYFLVMEYVDGDDLKAWLAQHERLPVAWACECIRQSALGLQHAHENGLVHRDIKPANLLIVRGEQDELPHVKILDMGLARFASERQEEGGLTKTGQIMGTPDYIAPEQAESTRDADIRADIFSLGCTLFQMLTGRVPFEGSSLVEKLMARVRQDAPRVRSLRPDVPEELDAVIAGMLARNPNERFQTPDELAEALSPFSLATMPRTHEPATPLQPDRTRVTETVQAKADATLNRFLHNLEDQAVEMPAIRGAGAAKRPASSPPLQQRALLAGSAAALILLLVVFWFVAGQARTVEIDKPPAGNGTVGQSSTMLESGKHQPPAPKPITNSDGWIDLLSRADVAASFAAGAERLGSEVVLKKNGGYAGLTLPVVPHGSYELHVEFTREHGGQALYLMLPTGLRRLWATIDSSYQTHYCGVSGVPDSGIPYEITNRQKHDLVATVERLAGAMRITAKVNDKQVVSWMGSETTAKFKEPTWAGPLPPEHLGIGSKDSKVRLHRIELRMLDGEARFVAAQ